MPPEVMLDHIYWSFGEPIPQSPEQLIEDVSKFYEEVYEEKFDKKLLTEISTLKRLNVTYTYVKRSRPNDGEWVKFTETVKIDDGDKLLTNADILWQIHKEAFKNLEDQDHQYFEGLELIKEDEDGVPLYDMFLGS